MGVGDNVPEIRTMNHVHRRDPCLSNHSVDICQCGAMRVGKLDWIEPFVWGELVIHITKRALASLTGSPTEDIAPRVLACGRTHEDWARVTSLESVYYGLTPENRPTCPMCAVLLDQALENAEVAP